MPCVFCKVVTECLIVKSVLRVTNIKNNSFSFLCKHTRKFIFHMQRRVPGKNVVWNIQYLVFRIKKECNGTGWMI